MEQTGTEIIDSELASLKTPPEVIVDMDAAREKSAIQKSKILARLQNIDFCQYAVDKHCVLIYLFIALIIIACVVNMSLFPQHSEIWVCLLSVSIGVIFPQPKLKKKKEAKP